MTTVMLVIYILSGTLTIDRYRTKDMAECMASMPAVHQQVPDTAVLVCVNVPDGSIV